MSPIASIFAGLERDIAEAAVRLFAQYGLALPFLKAASLAVSALLLAGTAYSIMQSRYHHLFSDRWMDRLGAKDVLARRMRRLWAEALADIRKTGDRAAWARALANAESVAQEGLKAKGYKALNGDDRVREAEKAGEMATLDALRIGREAYADSRDENAPLAHETAIAGLKAYKKTIRETGVMGEKF